MRAGRGGHWRRPQRFDRRGWTWALGGLVATTALRAGRRSAPTDEPRAYIVSPARPGSLGDEAFLTALVQQVTAIGYVPVLVVRDAAERWRLGRPVEVLALPGHMEAIPSRELLAFARRLSGNDLVVYPGVDVASGAYGTEAIAHLLLVAAASARATAAVVSLSWPERPERLAALMLRALPRKVPVVARDRVSLARLHRRARPTAVDGADVALLLRAGAGEPAAEVATVLETVERWRSEGTTVVAVNVSSLMFGIGPHDGSAAAGATVAAVVAQVAEALARFLAEPGRAVVLVPHDDRGTWSDVVLAADLRSRVPATAPCVVLPFATAADIRTVAAGCDAVLAGRLHLVIAGVVAGTPVAAISYEGKFAGLFGALGIPELLVEGSEELTAARVLELLDGLVGRRAEVATAIAERAPALVAAALRNVEVLPARN